jgi:hypothetical protein
MPKATFTFNLPDEENEYKVMSQAPNSQRMLWDFSQQLRAWYKYGHTFKDADDAVSKIRDEFYRLLNDHQVDIDL